MLLTVNRVMLTYGKRTLEGDVVSSYAVNSVVGDGGLSILQDGSNIDRLPLNRRL